MYAAMVSYIGWSNGLTIEPMQEQRKFVIDRGNLSSVGAFQASAVEVTRAMNCTPKPLHLHGTKDGMMEFSTSDMKPGSVLVRPQPALMTWVDQIKRDKKDSKYGATTTLIFAAINGAIEQGHLTNSSEIRQFFHSDKSFNGISAIACDISIDLKDSSFCTANVIKTRNCNTGPVLSKTSELVHNGGAWQLSVWIAAAIQFYSVSVYGTQPMFAKGNHDSLPIAWTSTEWGSSGQWSLKEIDHFVEVGSGALISAMAGSWTKHNKTLDSTLPMKRMDTRRSFILMLPPTVILLTVIIMLGLSFYTHKTAGFGTVRLANTAELISSSQTDDLKSFAEEARESDNSHKAFDQVKVIYAVIVEGVYGLVREPRLAKMSERA